ncbi:tRNA pseudouridine(55) synthase TruB [Corynebacterium sp. TAE3-ERU12]|uniref:tRNA pseudouridine(55) synthase TruB n=1 Tax=Corynebacterium sp. TAE3-ERU12 TaxID=2849491 RepID=UPI001C4542DE|nr:tRNA pseudouridine(55) synthase TruB [Corynebacterium sp. TAE3-ERU12]MBV7295252.1 tRNA pseudouridine(55) synthase TruB [Corynebacterium sp. TAE3-ERU12]
MSSSTTADSDAHTDPLADSGIVVVDKPQGLTSHDVVAKLRRIFHTRRVGHSGTLDPMATGVLVVGINRGTKFLPHVHADAKSYSATIRLGMATHTDDAEGEELSRTDATAVTDEAIREKVATLTGDIMQVPAAVSAIKIDGVRAHERIRRGEEVNIPARPVSVDCFEIMEIRRDTEGFVDIDVAVGCSAGTYVRSLARDLGDALGVGGHLTSLRRTSAGPFTIGDALSLEALEDTPVLSMSLDQACARCFPVRTVSADEAALLSEGQWLQPEGYDGVYAAQAPDGHVMALLEEQGKRAKPVFVARPSNLT